MRDVDMAINIGSKCLVSYSRHAVANHPDRHSRKRWQEIDAIKEGDRCTEGMADYCNLFEIALRQGFLHSSKDQFCSSLKNEYLARFRTL